MRVSGQLAVIAVLGAAGAGGWYAYQGGYLAQAPVIGSYVPAAGQQAGARRGRRGRARDAGPPRSMSTRSRPGASSRCAKPSAPCVPTNRSW